MYVLCYACYATWQLTLELFPVKRFRADNIANIWRQMVEFQVRCYTWINMLIDDRRFHIRSTDVSVLLCHKSLHDGSLGEWMSEILAKTKFCVSLGNSKFLSAWLVYFHCRSFSTLLFCWKLTTVPQGWHRWLLYQSKRKSHIHCSYLFRDRIES